MRHYTKELYQNCGTDFPVGHYDRLESLSHIGFVRLLKATDRRRRGSVLVLVMTLLGVLFVTGIAFLASMSFEADMIDVQRRQAQSDTAVGAVFNEVSAILQEGVAGALGAPFGGKLDAPFFVDGRRGPEDFGTSPIAVGEMPGVHNLFAPIEPYRPDPASDVTLFRWFTDLKGLTSEPFVGTLFRDLEINAAWISGTPMPGPPGLGLPIPVDSDGDGITDTLQFDVSELGFSPAQVAGLVRVLNAPSNPTGKVFLGMRVIAHGGLVNLNESHQNLVANVLDVPVDVLFNDGPHQEPGIGFFRHRPTLEQRSYSPLLEEPLLRRRALLPPRVIPPSLLHGNSFDTSDFGGADMPTKLFPPGETVLNPRYWRFTFGEEYSNSPNRPSLWAVRMEPFLTHGTSNIDRNEYDRRHLVTTVSYDDLLSRGGRVVDGFDDVTGEPNHDADLRQKMIDANAAASGDLPFKYPNYPHTLPNGNLRKGRLLLSLPWLDEALETGDITAAQRQRLIHDVFMMLVRNARGPYWEDIDCTTNASLCDPWNEVCQPVAQPKCMGGSNDGQVCMTDADCPLGRCAFSLCHDPITRQPHRLALVSRTAASLTANMIDYTDADDIPTRVALRSFDFSDLNTVGWEFGSARLPTIPPQFVYGLKRQPYITEIATVAEGNPPALKGRAVELYNPYDEDLLFLPNEDEYLLVEVDPSGATPRKDIPLRRVLRAEEFTVFVTDKTGTFSGITGMPGLSRVHTADVPLEFKDGFIIYLVRRVRVRPEDPSTTDIVVDQFTVGTGNTNIGQEGAALTGVDAGADGLFVFSMERVVPDGVMTPGSRWTAPIPNAEELPEDFHSLGNWNGRVEPSLRPVEVNFANTGSFTRLHPSDNPINPQFGTAFPTTGSLLLLMRHANRSLDDYEVTTTVGGFVVTVTNQDLAFTTWLDDETRYSVTVEESPGSGIFGTFNGLLPESEQIDNGRMPVFDLVFEDTGNVFAGRQYAHHIDPAINPTVDPPVTVDKPGGLMHLPWGQLVFDYFTALPLSSRGPYANTGGPPGDFELNPAAKPRVDLDGLRVHGRINLNAAPWKVLAGLPLMPMQKIPAPFRDKVRSGAGVSVPDDKAEQLGNELAQAIVAYRELRPIAGSGDYDNGMHADGTPNPAAGRGWGVPGPAARRGTGLLSVGALANVRHPGAANPIYRIDGGEVGSADADYVSAVAMLVALGDWATVRSHVFTIYGTLRGEMDDDILGPNPTLDDFRRAAADVDTRALRFQETVDRLPTFLGEQTPARIGERVVGKYIDVRND